MSIMSEEEGLAAGTLPLLHPQQIVCHREFAHFRVVFPAAARELLRRALRVEFRRNSSQECVVLDSIESLPERPFVLIARRCSGQRNTLPADQRNFQVMNLPLVIASFSLR